MTNPILIAAGILTFTIGVAGVFLPVLPSTPFFIITAGLLLKSSPALYNKLISNKLTGTYLSGKHGPGYPYIMTLAILVMWLAIVLTYSFATNDPVIKILLLLAGLAGTFFKGRIIYLIYKPKNSNNGRNRKINRQDER
ncbi:MAG: YbaN family protein [Bacteroidales bacterium]|jgi:hypothetical protein|nr:YbaN family protein [Bacteroidales bacterium]